MSVNFRGLWRSLARAGSADSRHETYLRSVVLVAGYVVAGVFEVAGIVLVVLDVWLDRRRARGFAERRPRAHIPFRGPGALIRDGFDDWELRRNPGSARAHEIQEERRRRIERDSQRVAIASARAEAEIFQAVADMLRGNLVRRVGGPAFLVIGVVVGTVANVANTH